MHVTATRARDDADLHPHTPINCLHSTRLNKRMHQSSVKLDAQVQIKHLTPHRRRRTGQRSPQITREAVRHRG